MLANQLAGKLRARQGDPRRRSIPDHPTGALSPCAFVIAVTEHQHRHA
jgi:hypothetical protein